MGLPGVETGNIDPELVEATEDFAAVLAATIEIGAGQVEPSHLLVALARVPGGAAAALLDGEQIPVDVLVDALRRTTAAAGGGGSDGTADATSLDDAPLSPETRKLLAALASGGETVTERTLLVEVVHHLEPRARSLLEEFGRVDLDAWRREVAAGPPAPIAVFDDDGRLVRDAFTPSAQLVLDSVATEAAAGGHRTPGTVLLLHAMAGVVGGLLEQASPFVGFDLRDVLARTRLLLSRGADPQRARRGDGRVALDADVVARALRTVLERAGEGSVRRRAARVAEPDLMLALLDVRGGTAEGVLRAATVDVERLRRFAETLFVEPDGGTAGAAGARPPLASVPEGLDRFRSSLIGQPAAHDQLLPLIEMIMRSARRGFRMGERPMATFLFCGPSGTGKTMTARLIAEAVFGSRDDIIVFEMGQFNSRESINTFIGAPPGYVGFGEGQLTNGLTRKPRCVLLFDEVEKAHRLVGDALLRLLDEGWVNDPAGPVRDARETVVVLTSNLGAREFAELGRRRLWAASAGPDQLDRALEAVTGTASRAADAEPDVPSDDDIRRRLRGVLEGALRPEFLNRVDEIVLFASFGVDELTAIAEAGLAERARAVDGGLGVTLRWDDTVAPYLARTATQQRPDEAARGVNRCVDTVLALVLRRLDEAEESGIAVSALRVVVDADEMDVVVDDR